MNVVISTCAGQVIYHNTQLVVRRAGIWPSSRSAEKPANTPVASLAANHVHFNVQNPRVNSFSMFKGRQFEYDSRHRRHNIHVAPPADNRTFSAATERSTVTMQ